MKNNKKSEQGDNFRNCLNTISNIMHERYRSKINGSASDAVKGFLLSKANIRDFEACIDTKISQLLNLYLLLDTADEIDRYCFLLNELKQLQSIHAVQTLVLIAGDKALSSAQQAVEDKYAAFRIETGELELRLVTSGFILRRSPNNKMLDISPQMSDESLRHFFRRLFTNVTNYKEAIELYIKFTDEKDLFLYSRIEELRVRLMLQGLVNETIAYNDLYDYIKKQVEK
jgi:hypothetical protein